MGWCINLVVLEIEEILGDRFIKYYSTVDSMSAFWIVTNAEITREEIDKITSLFPERIRVEFEMETEEQISTKESRFEKLGK